MNLNRGIPLALVFGALFALACDDSSSTGSSGSSGAQIAFTAQPGGTGNEGIFRMNASDGGGQTRLTASTADPSASSLKRRQRREWVRLSWTST